MLTLFIGLAIGFALLVAGAHILVRGASAIALRLGLSPLVVGLTVVAFGTSSPELAVSIKSAIEGAGGIALGNIVGSNLFNITVVLGISALITTQTVHLQLLRWDVPIMLGASALFLALTMSDGELQRWEGAILLAGIIAYTTFAVRLARREVLASATPLPVSTVETVAATPNKIGRSSLMIAAGLLLLTGGSELLVRASVALAERWEVPPAIIGLTIVAAGTSLPELATSVIASLRRETDLAVGNVIGSNIFNVLGIGGTAGLAGPVEAGGLNGLDIGMMALASVLLLPLMRSGFRIVRAEGLLLFAIYGLYLFLRWP